MFTGYPFQNTQGIYPMGIYITYPYLRTGVSVLAHWQQYRYTVRAKNHLDMFIDRPETVDRGKL